MAKKELSKSLKTFYGIATLGNVLRGNMTTTYQTFFLTDVAMFPLAITAVISTVISTINTFIVPLLGALIEGTKPLNKKWGRYRSWILVAPFIVMLIGPFAWVRIGKEDWTAAIIYMAASILVQIPTQLALQSEKAILPMIANNGEERSMLASRSFMWQNIGRLISAYAVAKVVAIMTGKGLSSARAYLILASTFGVIAFLTFYAEFAMTKGYEGEGVEDKILTKRKERASLGDILKNFVLNPPLMILFIANIGTSIVSYIFSGCAAYYWRYVAEDFGRMGTYTLCVNIGGILGTIVCGELSKRIDTKKLSLIALTGMALAFVGARLVGLEHPWLFIACMAFHQFCASTNYPLFVSMYSNCVTYGEWKTGQNASAFIMGLTNIPLSIAQVIKGILIPAALAAAGYVAGEAPTLAVKNGLLNIYVTWPMVCLAVSFCMMAFFFKLNNAKVEELQKEIDERKLAEAEKAKETK